MENRKYLLVCLIVGLVLLGLAACGKNTTKGPSPVSATPRLADAFTATGTRQPNTLAPTHSSTGIAHFRAETATHTVSPTPAQTRSLSSPNQLATRFWGLDLTATAQVLSATPTPSLTPTFNLPAYPPQTVTPHALALNAGIAAGMTLLREIGDEFVQRVDWTPDGRYLAVFTASDVSLYDSISLERVQGIETGHTVSAYAFRPDGLELATWNGFGIELWDVATGQLKRVIGSEMECVSCWNLYLEYGWDGQIITFGVFEDDRRSASKTYLRIWDLDSGRKILEDQGSWGISGIYDIRRDTHEIYYLADSRNVNLRRMTILNLDTGQIREAPLSLGETRFLSPDGSAVIGISSFWIYATRLSDGTSIRRNLSCDQLLRGGDQLVCIKDNWAIYLDPVTLENSIVVSFPESLTRAVVGPNEQIAWLRSGEINVFNRDRDGMMVLRPVGRDSVSSWNVGTLDVNGQRLDVVAGVSLNGSIHVWDLDSGKEIFKHSGSGQSIRSLAFSPDLRHLAWCDQAQEVYLWDVVMDRMVFQISLRSQDFSSLTFSDDNRFLLLFGGWRLTPLDLKNGVIQEPVNLTLNAYEDESVPIVIFGRTVMPGYSYSSLPTGLTLWYADAGKKLNLPYTSFEPKQNGWDQIVEAAISPDRRYLAVKSITGQVVLYDLNTPTLHTTLFGRERSGDALSLAFNPSSDVLVSSNRGGINDLWTATAKQVLPQSVVTGFRPAFTPDGRYLVTYYNGTLRVWGLPLN